MQQAEGSQAQQAQDGSGKCVSSGTIIVLTQNLFHNLAIMVNPVWELSQPEAKSFVESLDAAYPMIDLGKFAKIFFWFNVTMLFAPRVIITLRDLARKGKAKDEVNANPGQKG